MKSALSIVAVLTLAGCSGTTGPIVDTNGVNMAAYQADLAQCETYATQVSTGRAVSKGAAAGAAVGGAIGAIAGGNVGEAAGVGAVSGGAESARIADREKAQVVGNCLRGRGYRVLN